MSIKALCRNGTLDIYAHNTAFGVKRQPAVEIAHARRLYSEASLAVRQRKKTKSPATQHLALQIAQNVNKVWRMNCVSHRLSNARHIKC